MTHGDFYDRLLSEEIDKKYTDTFDMSTKRNVWEPLAENHFAIRRYIDRIAINKDRFMQSQNGAIALVYEVCKLSNETGNVAPDLATLRKRDMEGRKKRMLYLSEACSRYGLANRKMAKDI
ncbi:hypothetical protein NQ318_003911 [Aromia moschata]|uniref:Uncharacterized protein n=1 Tax=Aromia moschata TaxID=1265417 RepID=A0AAV8Z8A5_9CUCU|nr:hypothetical protein NQ318_003911 [Aromia moschata]